MRFVNGEFRQLIKFLNLLFSLEKLLKMSMPLIGFGTWVDIEGGQEPMFMGPVTQTALEVGYRHFDTSFSYNTEPFVVESIVKSGIPRGQVFLTNKSGNAPMPINLQSKLSQIGYYDLFLLHHPPLETGKHFETQVLKEWRQMNELLKSGLVKAIGVSNFYSRQLEVLLKLCEIFNLVKPCVNQIELHPFNQNWDLVAFCHTNEIQVVAHTPLGGLASRYILQSNIIKEIAEEIGATPSQVVLASTMKRGIGVIPRSLDRSRMIENFQSINFISKITDTHLNLMRQLDIKVPMIMLASAAFEMNSRV